MKKNVDMIIVGNDGDNFVVDVRQISTKLLSTFIVHKQMKKKIQESMSFKMLYLLLSIIIEFFFLQKFNQLCW